MAQYNTLNVALSYSQFSTLKLEIKHGTEVTLSLLLNIVDNSSDDTNFPHKLLSTNTQVSKICKASAIGYQLI